MYTDLRVLDYDVRMTVEGWRKDRGRSEGGAREDQGTVTVNQPLVSLFGVGGV